MNTVWDILFARRPVLNYVSPPICEVIFSGSSNPIIILSQAALNQITGLAFGGFGGFQLSWNAFPGAICYNVYYIGGDDVAVILAQCVTEPTFPVPPGIDPGEVTVTPVTEEGEGPPADPIPIPPTGGGGTDTVYVTSCPMTSSEGFPAPITFHRDFTSTGLTISYTLSGMAVSGVDYQPLPGTIHFGVGQSEVSVDVVPIEATLHTSDLILTIDEAPNYAVGTPGEVTVQIIKPLYRIKDYGTIGTPLLIPAPGDSAGLPAAAPAPGCEWDGSVNYISVPPEPPLPDFEQTYRDADGNIQNVAETVQGTQLYFVAIQGPYSPVGSPLVRWQVGVAGMRTNGAVYTIWQGYRTQAEGGTTAAGVYLNAGGPGGGVNFSDNRDTLEFEAFP